jgi:hypothetical protein
MAEIDNIDFLVRRLEDNSPLLRDFRVVVSEGVTFLQGKCSNTNFHLVMLRTERSFCLLLCQVLNELGCNHDRSQEGFYLGRMPSQHEVMWLLSEALNLESNVYVHNLLICIRKHGDLYQHMTWEPLFNEIFCHHLKMAMCNELPN